MLLHLFFFCSGISGLLYQVVWVRQFGNVYGNTVYSASIVVAIFMLGLGLGSYVFGVLADRRYQSRPESLVRLYGVLELLIAGFGLVVSLVLPHLGGIVARLSSYETDSVGWQALTFVSHLGRGAMAVVLLAPMTVLMGGTLTVLVRAVVQSDLRSSGWRVALLYGVNTAGAATGAFLTDFALVPAVGLMATQLAAVGLNLIAAAGAFGIARDVVCVAACAATTDHHDDGLAGRALGGPCAGVVGVRCARHGNRLVATSCRVARRLPRGLLASSHRDARRPGRGSVAGRMARSPIRAARTNADDRRSTLCDDDTVRSRVRQRRGIGCSWRCSCRHAWNALALHACARGTVVQHPPDADRSCTAITHRRRGVPAGEWNRAER